MSGCAQWTAQDVERFREQQRWRMRQGQALHLHATHPPRLHAFARPEAETEARDRTRKVSYKFRKEHQHFLHKQQQQQQWCQPTPSTRQPFPIVFGRKTKAESPLPHMGHSMFNAFDSTASPETFSLEQPPASSSDNQHDDGDGEGSRGRHEDEDMAMLIEDDDGNSLGRNDGNSLWRRRLYVQGQQRRSPKLGRVALWDAAGQTFGHLEDSNNQLMEQYTVQRVPHPFASSQDDDM